MGQYVSFEQVTDEALRYAAASLELVLTPTVHNHLLQAYQTLRSFPEVPGVLQKLTQRYALVVLSNGTAAQLQTLLQRSSLESCFAAVLSAEQVQVLNRIPAYTPWQKRPCSCREGR